MQTPVYLLFAGVFKFLVDGVGDGFFNDHVINALQTLNYLLTVSKGFILAAIAGHFDHIWLV